MAINWGRWEYSGGNGMRVGIEIEGWTDGAPPGDINNGDTQCQTWVSFYTENQYSMGDDQHMSLGGAFGGGTNFYNGQGGGVTRRERRLYEYNYGNNEYGSSPGKVTFTASVNGVYNGVTPSNSVTDNIPARPIAAPNDPTNVNADYISDGSIKITWSNKDTSARPWQDVYIDRQINNGSWSRRANLGGGATSYTDSTSGDTEYQYRVLAHNSSGNSSWVNTQTIWTTPDAPSNAVRTASGSDQILSWTNHASTNDYATEIWRAVNGAWGLLAVVGTGVDGYTDTTASITDQVKYRMRAKNELGSPVRYSSFSNETSETLGATSPPSAPTNLAPDGALLIPTQDSTLSWQHNPTDTSAQTSFQIRWRESGTTVWNYTGRLFTAAESWLAPAGTFPGDTEVEWGVQTWGADVTGSIYSTAATFITTTNPNALRETKRPVVLDTDTGRMETADLGVLPPIGSMTMFAGLAAPAGWLMCEGQELVQTEYPELFAVVGQNFSKGNEAAGNFRVPDMRLRLPIGADPSSVALAFGETDGSESMSARSDSFSHNHKHTTPNTVDNAGGHDHGAGQLVTTQPPESDDRGYAAGGENGNIENHTHPISGTTASAGNHNHDLPDTDYNIGIGGGIGSAHAYTALHFIIKA